MDLVEMFRQMTAAAWAVAIVLFIMSFWSIGVAIERFYTFSQGAEAVQAVRAAGRQAPEGRPFEGGDRALWVEGLPLQPPRKGRAWRDSRSISSSRRAAAALQP